MLQKSVHAAHLRERAGVGRPYQDLDILRRQFHWPIFPSIRLCAFQYKPKPLSKRDESGFQLHPAAPGGFAYQDFFVDALLQLVHVGDDAYQPVGSRKLRRV